MSFKVMRDNQQATPPGPFDVLNQVSDTYIEFLKLHLLKSTKNDKIESLDKICAYPPKI